MRSFNFVNHSYDYRPNWTLLSPITIINRGPLFFKVKFYSIHLIFLISLFLQISDLFVRNENAMDTERQERVGRRAVCGFYFRFFAPVVDWDFKTSGLVSVSLSL